MLLQGKIATVMRRTVKGGGGGGSKAGTAGSPSNAVWYGPGNERSAPTALLWLFRFD